MRILKGFSVKKAPDSGAFFEGGIAEKSIPSARRASYLVAETAVLNRGPDIDAHGVVQRAFRGDLVQLERLRHAVELPVEFPGPDLDFYDLAARDVDGLRLRRDHDGAVGRGAARGGLAVDV